MAVQIRKLTGQCIDDMSDVRSVSGRSWNSCMYRVIHFCTSSSHLAGLLDVVTKTFESFASCHRLHICSSDMIGLFYVCIVKWFIGSCICIKWSSRYSWTIEILGTKVMVIWRNSILVLNPASRSHRRSAIHWTRKLGEERLEMVDPHELWSLINMDLQAGGMSG